MKWIGITETIRTIDPCCIDEYVQSMNVDGCTIKRGPAGVIYIVSPAKKTIVTLIPQNEGDAENGQGTNDY